MGRSFMDYAQSAIQANRLFAALDSIATLAINLSVAAILYTGGNLAGSGAMEIGGITAVTEYAIWILFYIMMAQMVVIMVPKALVCMERMAEILSLEPEIQDKPGALSPSLPSDQRAAYAPLRRPLSQKTKLPSSPFQTLPSVSRTQMRIP